MSLDLILGYAGIVSLGHAAFFGIGAYTAGLLAVHGWGEPLIGLLAAAAVAARSPASSSSFLVVRGSDLTRLMVTLGIGLMLYEAANKAAFDHRRRRRPVRRDDVEASSALFRFDLGGRTAYLYSLVVLFVAVRAVAPRSCNSPFGLCCAASARAASACRRSARRSRGACVAIFTVSAAMAGVAGALLAQTTQFVGIDTLGFPRSAELLIMLVLGGAGRLYGGLVGAAVFMIAQDYLSGINPGVLAVLARPPAGRRRAVRARRHPRRRSRRCATRWRRKRAR